MARDEADRTIGTESNGRAAVWRSTMTAPAAPTAPAAQVHPFDRLVARPGMVWALNWEDGFSVCPAKADGTPNKRHLHAIGYQHTNPVCAIYFCDLCGIVGSKKKVHIRNDVYRWNCGRKDWAAKSKNLLCTGCWSRARALVKREEKICEVIKLIDKTLKELKNERNKKHSNDRPTA